MTVAVEGAAERDIDLLVTGERNEPQVFSFDGDDVNRDGRIDVEVRASTKTQDPNVLINVIWVFASGYPVSPDAVISGSATPDAEVYVDCGMEPQLLQSGSKYAIDFPPFQAGLSR